MSWALEKLFGLVVGLFPASLKFWVELVVCLLVLAVCAGSGAWVMGKVKDVEVKDAQTETETAKRTVVEFAHAVDTQGKQQEIESLKTEATQNATLKTVTDDYREHRTVLLSSLERVLADAAKTRSTGFCPLPEVASGDKGHDAATTGTVADRLSGCPAEMIKACVLDAQSVNLWRAWAGKESIPVQ